jgi:ATP-binding cassette subfamily B protein
MPQNNSSKRVVQFLFGLWRIAPRLTWAMIIVQILFAVLTATVAPIFVSHLLTQVARGTASLQSSGGLLGAYAVVLILGDVIAVRVTIAMAFLSESRMQASVAKRILESLSHKSMNYHGNHMSGGIVSDSGKLNGSIERFWDTLVFTAVPIAATVISVCIALCFIFWQYAVVLGVLSIIIIAVIVRLQSSIAPISRDVADKWSSMTAYLADVVTNISAVKAFANEKIELDHYSEKVELWRKANLREMKSVLLITGSFGAMMTVMNIAAFVVAIFATQYHIANIGIVYLVISYTLNVVSQLWTVGNTTRAYIRIIGDAGPMISTLDEPLDLHDIESPKKLSLSEGRVEFKDMSFTHNENNEALFKDFNLTISPGERIGLVGQSGSGKTTLTRLLLRFNDIDGGAILIDGQNIAEVSQYNLRKSIAYVPQEPLLFHRTLRENIAYGNPDATEKDVLYAAKQAHAIGFIQKLPKGFDTLVGERGIKLSGGQRQRIAIARAILKNAPILVLDEATSALDSESEVLIQDALSKLMKDRTSIVIAHRLSTIAKLDRIIVLDDGKIIEQGSHTELISRNGMYAKLWSHQSGGFIEEE